MAEIFQTLGIRELYQTVDLYRRFVKLQLIWYDFIQSFQGLNQDWGIFDPIVSGLRK